MSWIDLSGRTAVVTGAGGGIGEGIALALAGLGAAVMVLDRDEAGANRVAQAIVASGGKAYAVVCDVADPASIDAAAAQSETVAGPCRILVNNAGYMAPGGLDTLKLADWNRMLAVNLTGYFLCAQAFGAQMLAAGAGSLVHVASIAASSPQGFSGAYSVGKAGIVMLSQQLATEWGPRGVRSNVVSPGLVRTPMTREIYETPGILQQRQDRVPVRRIGAPADIADAVTFLASDRAGYITGEEIIVDGGFTRTIMSTIPRPGFTS